jgi:hypothetical protein
MRVRYKNNMTGREIIGQKRLLFATKPAHFDLTRENAFAAAHRPRQT